MPECFLLLVKRTLLSFVHISTKIVYGVQITRRFKITEMALESKVTYA